MKYKIVGQCLGSDKEEIDETDSLQEAEKMMDEYIMAFGPSWEIWLEKNDAN